MRPDLDLASGDTDHMSRVPGMLSRDEIGASAPTPRRSGPTHQ